MMKGKLRDLSAINLLSLRPNRDVPCVSYESVDRAFNAAKQRMNLPGPRGRSMTDIDVDHLGQILVETARNLAQE